MVIILMVLHNSKTTSSLDRQTRACCEKKLCKKDNDFMKKEVYLFMCQSHQKTD